MRLLVVARIAIWSACLGSIIVFLLPYFSEYGHGAARYAQDFLSSATAFVLGKEEGFNANSLYDLNEAANSANKDIDHISAAWHLLTAALIAIGATGARYAYKIDRRLNDKWHWVSKTQDGDRILRLAIGHMTITDIHKFSKRQKNPEQVIEGTMTSVIDWAGRESSEENHFHATNIVAGRKDSKILYFDWLYTNGHIATGITKIIYTETQIGILRRLRGGSPIFLSGKFMLDASAGSGTISYYSIQSDANVEYNRMRPLVVQPMPTASEVSPHVTEDLTC